MPHVAPAPHIGTPNFPSCDKAPRRPIPGEEWDRLERVAREHAPVFWLHEEEPYRPISPQDFLSRATMSYVQKKKMQKQNKGPLSPAAKAAGAKAGAKPAPNVNATSVKSAPADAGVEGGVPESVYELTSPQFRSGVPQALAGNTPIYSDLFVRDSVLSVRYYPFFAYSKPPALELHLVTPPPELAVGKNDPTPLHMRKQNAAPDAELPPVKNPYLIFRNAIPLADEDDYSTGNYTSFGNVGAHEGDWRSVEVLIDLVTNAVLGVIIESGPLTAGAVAGGETRTATTFIPRSKLSFNAEGRVELFIAKSSHHIYTQLNTPWDDAHREYRNRNPLPPSGESLSTDPQLNQLSTSTLDNTREDELRDDDGNDSPQPRLATKFSLVPTESPIPGMPAPVAVLANTGMEPSKHGRQRVFGVVLDCDMARNYLGVAMYDETSKGIAWDASRVATFPRATPTTSHIFATPITSQTPLAPVWLDAPIRWGRSPAYRIPANHGALNPFHRVCATPGSRTSLIKMFKEHLARQRHDLLSHIPRKDRHGFATGLVTWMCNTGVSGGIFEKTLLANVDAPVGLLSPLSEKAQNATAAAQRAHCSAALAAEKLAQADLAQSVSDILLRKQQTDRATAGAAQETTQRQEELAQALAELNAAERKIAHDKERMQWTAKKKELAKTELSQAHARVAETRQALVRTRGLVQTIQQQLQHVKQQHRAELARRRAAQRSAHFYGNRGPLKPQPVALTALERQRELDLESQLKRLTDTRDKEMRLLQMRTSAVQKALLAKNIAVTKDREAKAELARSEAARARAQERVQQARVLLATAQHHYELSAIRQAELEAMLQAAQRAEQKVLAARRQSYEKERVGLEKIEQEAHNTTRKWRHDTRIELQQKAKKATPAEIAKLQKLIQDARARDAKALEAVHIAEQKEREFVRSHHDDQVAFKTATATLAAAKEDLKQTREALKATTETLQSAAKQKGQKDYVLRLRRQIHELQEEEKARVKAVADAERAVSAAEAKFVTRVAEERKLRDLAHTARARRAATREALKKFEGDLDDLQGTRIEARLTELEKETREKKWIPHIKAEREKLRDRLAKDLRATIAKIRDEQKKEIDETQKAARALHEAKVAAFLAQTKARDAELAISRFSANLNVAENNHKRNEQAVNAAREHLKQAELQVTALKQQAANMNSTVANLQKEVDDLQKQQRSVLAEISRLSRPGAASLRGNQASNFMTIRSLRENLTRLSGRLASRSHALSQARNSAMAMAEKLHTAEHLVVGRRERVKQLELRVASSAARVKTAKRELHDAEKAAAKARHDEGVAKQTYLRLEQSKQLRIQSHQQRV